MVIMEAAFWGLVGVVLFEAYELWAAAEPDDGRPRWPWRDAQGQRVVGAYVVAAVTRVIMGTGLNVVYAAAHQMGGPFAAVTIGMTAPLLIARLGARRPDALDPPGEPLPSAPAKPSFPEQAETDPTTRLPTGGIDAC
jgi:hypothetical protein